MNTTEWIKPIYLGICLGIVIGIFLESQLPNQQNKKIKDLTKQIEAWEAVATEAHLEILYLKDEICSLQSTQKQQD